MAGGDGDRRAEPEGDRRGRRRAFGGAEVLIGDKEADGGGLDDVGVVAVEERDALAAGDRREGVEDCG